MSPTNHPPSSFHQKRNVDLSFQLDPPFSLAVASSSQASDVESIRINQHLVTVEGKKLDDVAAEINQSPLMCWYVLDDQLNEHLLAEGPPNHQQTLVLPDFLVSGFFLLSCVIFASDKPDAPLMGAHQEWYPVLDPVDIAFQFQSRMELVILDDSFSAIPSSAFFHQLLGGHPRSRWLTWREREDQGSETAAPDLPVTPVSFRHLKSYTSATMLGRERLRLSFHAEFDFSIAPQSYPFPLARCVDEEIVPISLFPSHFLYLPHLMRGQCSFGASLSIESLTPSRSIPLAVCRWTLPLTLNDEPLPLDLAPRRNPSDLATSAPSMIDRPSSLLCVFFDETLHLHYAFRPPWPHRDVRVVWWLGRDPFDCGAPLHDFVSSSSTESRYQVSLTAAPMRLIELTLRHSVCASLSTLFIRSEIVTLSSPRRQLFSVTTQVIILRKARLSDVATSFTFSSIIWHRMAGYLISQASRAWRRSRSSRFLNPHSCYDHLTLLSFMPQFRDQTISPPHQMAVTYQLSRCEAVWRFPSHKLTWIPLHSMMVDADQGAFHSSPRYIPKDEFLSSLKDFRLASRSQISSFLEEAFRHRLDLTPFFPFFLPLSTADHTKIDHHDDDAADGK